MAPEDEDFLQKSRGLTEYLLTYEDPQSLSFFSFLQLPSGCWTLVRRFVARRIVTHALVFGQEVLAALDYEPSLLVSCCEFRTLGGSDRQLAYPQLQKIASNLEVGAHHLADLEWIPLPDLHELVVEEVTKRRDALLRYGYAGDRQKLAADLAWVFSVLETGGHVLLDQQPSYELLLRLAWSSLPPRDRLRCPWTTHFGPGGRVVFRLINAPEPARARRLQDRPGDWLILGEPLRGSVSRSVELLTRRVVNDGQEEAVARCDDYRRHPDLSLLSRRGMIERWLAESAPSHDMTVGFSSTEGLEDYLRQYIAPSWNLSRLDPWIDPVRVLFGCCNTVLRLAAGGSDFDHAVDEVYQAICRPHLQALVLHPDNVAKLDPGTFTDLRATAVALQSGTLRPPPIGLRSRLELLDSLGDWRHLDDRSVSLEPRMAEVLVGLALDLSRCKGQGGGEGSLGKATGRDLLAVLARRSPEHLTRACSLLLASPQDFPAVLAVLEVAAAEHRATTEDEPRIQVCHTILANLVAETLKPLLASHPELGEGGGREQLVRILGTVPGDILSALPRAWQGEQLGRARLTDDGGGRAPELIVHLNRLAETGRTKEELLGSLDECLPPEDDPRRPSLVFELATSGKLWPTVVTMLEEEYLADALADLVEQDVGELMRPDRLKMASERAWEAIARKLGQSARRNPHPVIRFLRWALDHAEHKVVVRIVATLLDASTHERPNRWSFLTYLKQEGRDDLLRRVEELASGLTFRACVGEIDVPALRALAEQRGGPVETARFVDVER